MLITRKKYTFILREGPTEGLDGSALTADKKYSINFAENNKNFCWSLHYNGANRYLIVNGAGIINLSKRFWNCSISIMFLSKNFSIENTKKKQN